MDTNNNLQPNTSNPTPQHQPSKHKYLVMGSVLALIVALIFMFKPFNSSKKETEVDQKKSVYNRDEPTEQQIYQDDYKQKVEEMLDSGKSIIEISRETGIRKDIIKKIKKNRE